MSTGSTVRDREYTLLCPFGGLGAGALGFMQARVDELVGASGRFRLIGGIDNDNGACKDFVYLTGAPSLSAAIQQRLKEYEDGTAAFPAANTSEITSVMSKDGKTITTTLTGSAARLYAELSGRAAEQCAVCGVDFLPDNTPEEAEADMRQAFGAGATVEECEVVCEDCYRKITPGCPS